MLEEVWRIFWYKMDWLLVLFANVATNPVLNIIYMRIYLISCSACSFVIVVLEMAVVWVEYRLICHGLNNNTKRWFFLSLAANTISYTVGLVLM